MPYFTFDELSALIPDGWLTESLDDDASGDADKFSVVEAAARRAVNGPMGIEDDTSVAVTQFMKQAALIIAASICYGRRNIMDKFPYALELKGYRDTLQEIAKERLTRIAPSGTVPTIGAIIQPARTNSSRMAF